MTPSPLRIVPLPYLRLLQVTGTDATAFLQGQLSRRVDNLSADASALAGWHDARGRVRAVFRVLRCDDGFLLAAPADLAEQLGRTLQMFVLRADVTIVVTDLICAGIATQRNVHHATGLPSDLTLPATVNAVTRSGALRAVCVAVDCWHVVAPPGAIDLRSDDDAGAVVAAEIRAGVPHIDARSTLRYVPHMLNLDRLDAIDFRKGCYPGQEIIARTQNLGSVKRRLCAFRTVDGAADRYAPAAPTQASPTSDDRTDDEILVDAGNERIGEVLRCARDGNLLTLQAIVTLAQIDDGVHLNSTDGPALERIVQPFER